MILRPLAAAVAVALTASVLVACNGSSNDSAATTPTQPSAPVAQGSTPGVTAAADQLTTATPIKHLVVIYPENESFDHYFGTYPYTNYQGGAANGPALAGEPTFTAAQGTPSVNNLITANLLAPNNPNSTQPFRMDRSQANTASMNHNYTPEQLAYDGGKADKFPENTGRATTGAAGAFGTTGQVMGYFDGNTVTALWQYAQNYAMSDNAYTDTYGPSTPGALEVVAGQTNGMMVGVVGSKTTTPGGAYIDDGQNGFTIIGDIDPAGDVCSSTSKGTAYLTGKNIGDLLNAANIPWGGFMGGFDLSVINDNGTTGCARSNYSYVTLATKADYTPHHAWFQYFKSTANPTHARPSSVSAIGYTYEADGKTKDPANHDYDYNDFVTAVQTGNYPAVAYIKAPAFQDGHPGNSDPLDEQTFEVKVINFLMKQPDWKNTAVIIAYDDSDGWYDHAFAQPSSYSYDATADQINGAGQCGPTSGAAAIGVNGKPINGRCGPGTRIPFLVISPYAKQNFVSHTQISQASVIRFIEDNWLAGKRIGAGAFDATAGSIMDMFDFSSAPRTAPLLLSPSTGEPTSS